MNKPLRSTFERDLTALQDDIVRLQERVDTAISHSLECLKNRDPGLAQQVIDRDQEINDLRFKIEEDCFRIIATQQPTAVDLRVILAAMNIIIDMERMGDYATGIAKTVIRMGDEPLLKPLIDIPRMVELAREMLRECLIAFKEQDANRAKRIAERDDEMDHLYKAIFDELVEIMAVTPGSAERATYLLWCAHNLERIGDRVTNIAERVVFIATGNMKELNV
jgi:phosphate transport system protein